MGDWGKWGLFVSDPKRFRLSYFGVGVTIMKNSTTLDSTHHTYLPHMRKRSRGRLRRPSGHALLASCRTSSHTLRILNRSLLGGLADCLHNRIVGRRRNRHRQNHNHHSKSSRGHRQPRKARTGSKRNRIQRGFSCCSYA